MIENFMPAQRAQYVYFYILQGLVEFSEAGSRQNKFWIEQMQGKRYDFNL